MRAKTEMNLLHVTYSFLNYAFEPYKCSSIQLLEYNVENMIQFESNLCYNDKMILFFES